MANYKEKDEDLVLHWGVGIKNAGEWVGAEEKYLPPTTIKLGDGKASQTIFEVNKENP